MPERRYGGHSVGGRYVRVSQQHQAAGVGCALLIAAAAGLLAVAAAVG